MGKHFERGSAFYSLSRFKEAADAFSQELIEEPNSPYAHAMLAAAMGAMRQYKSAEMSARRAIELAPQWQYGYYILGVTEGLQGKLRKAEATFLEALRLESTAEIHYRLAKIYSITHRVNECLDATAQALAMEPFHADSLLLRGETLVLLGKLDEAQQLFRTALSDSPENPEAHHALGRLNLKRGETAEALDLLREARRLDPLSKNHAGAIAMAYGRTLKPFCRIDRFVPRWYLWPHKKRWLLYLALTLLLSVSLPLKFLWPNEYYVISLVTWTLVFNALTFPHTFDQAAAIVARYAARQEFQTQWYHALLHPFVILWVSWFHLLATGFAVVVASAPDIGMLAFSIVPCIPFVVGIVRSPGVISRLVCILMTVVSAILGTAGGISLVYIGGAVSIAFFATYWTVTYFAEDFCNWLTFFRSNLLKRLINST